MFASETDYLKTRVERDLVGATLTGVRVDPDDEALVLVFTRTTRSRKLDIEVAVLMDPEGNGPGWLDIPRVPSIE